MSLSEKYIKIYSICKIYSGLLRLNMKCHNLGSYFRNLTKYFIVITVYKIPRFILNLYIYI